MVGVTNLVAIGRGSCMSASKLFAAGRTTTTSTSTGCRRGYSCTQAEQRPRTAGQSCCWPSSRQPDGAYDSELVVEPSASASLCSVLSRRCRKHTCSIQVYCRVAVLAEGVAVRVCPECDQSVSRVGVGRLLLPCPVSLSVCICSTAVGRRLPAAACLTVQYSLPLSRPRPRPLSLPVCLAAI